MAANTTGLQNVTLSSAKTISADFLDMDLDMDLVGRGLIAMLRGVLYSKVASIGLKPDK